MLQHVKDFFQLSNTEQKGFIVLLLLIIAMLLLPKIWRNYQQPQPFAATTFTEWIAEQESVAITPKEVVISNVPVDANVKIDVVLAPFNPNTANFNELISLGFTSKTAQTLINFRNSGGKFYKKEDVKKVYGITENEYQRLEPFINIPKQASDWQKTNEYAKPDKIDNPKLVAININTADSLTFTQLRGIGPTYAARIVKYRNLLGGFNNIAQLTEVYGISDSLVQSFTAQLLVDPTAINQISINTATVKTLKAHPYISEALALGIVNYREQNGPFLTLDDMKKLYILDEQTYLKIAPYLKLE